MKHCMFVISLALFCNLAIGQVAERATPSQPATTVNLSTPQPAVAPEGGAVTSSNGPAVAPSRGTYATVVPSLFTELADKAIMVSNPNDVVVTISFELVDRFGMTMARTFRVVPPAQRSMFPIAALTPLADQAAALHLKATLDVEFVEASPAHATATIAKSGAKAAAQTMTAQSVTLAPSVLEGKIRTAISWAVNIPPSPMDWGSLLSMWITGKSNFYYKTYLTGVEVETSAANAGIAALRALKRGDTDVANSLYTKMLRREVQAGALFSNAAQTTNDAVQTVSDTLEQIRSDSFTIADVLCLKDEFCSLAIDALDTSTQYLTTSSMDGQDAAKKQLVATLVAKALLKYKVDGVSPEDVIQKNSYHAVGQAAAPYYDSLTAIYSQTGHAVEPFWDKLGKVLQDPKAVNITINVAKSAVNNLVSSKVEDGLKEMQVRVAEQQTGKISVPAPIYVAPTVGSATATNVTTTAATISATINPNGQATSFAVEYATNASFSGSVKTGSASVGAGSTASTFSMNLTGLAASASYWARLVATNATGSTNGAAVSFKTSVPPQKPSVGSATVANVTAIAATISGTINPNGQATSFAIEYATNASFSGSVKTGSASVGAGSTASTFSVNLIGLAASTSYWARLVATNATGSTTGAAVNFATSAPPQKPMVGSATATNVTSTSATISANVNPNGQSTSSAVEYATNSSFTNSVKTGSASAGAVASTFSINLSGLAAGTTYWARLVATNATGSTPGAAVSFTTSAQAPTIASVTPGTIAASRTALTKLTIVGTGFSTSGGSLRFTDPTGAVYSSLAHPERVVSVSPTQWQYNINNGGAMGTWRVQVVNSNGQASSTAIFAVR